MQQTTNYNLKKIELTDSPPDITVINPNWDTIDTAIKAVDNSLDDHKADMTAHGINNYAKKTQEDFIISTLQSGWLPVLDVGAQFSKNDLKIVTLVFKAKAGTITALTTVFNLPVGYRSVMELVFPIFDSATGTYTGQALYIHTDGRVRIPESVTLTTGTDYEGQISFYVN